MLLTQTCDLKSFLLTSVQGMVKDSDNYGIKTPKDDDANNVCICESSM